MRINPKNSLRTSLIISSIWIIWNSTISAQGTQIGFNTIPKSGTILVYSHLDDDLIWMLPFWKITEKFIGGAMPATPSYRTIISQQQSYLNNNGYNISYESNWMTPWSDITNYEYSAYYLAANPSYSYLVNDHLETRLSYNRTELSRYEINKIKAKLEQYFASPEMSRVITHNNWGEYGHMHHVGLNKAVRELAVKYRKDVWMLGCDNGGFIDIYVPDGITYTLGSFNNPDLYLGIRTIYQNNGLWTWYADRVPSGDHKFIKIVDHGSDKSGILKGDEITYPGPSQLETGSYIFDGDDDYLTLKGNNYPAFTISMRIRADQIKQMDIAAMSEYPTSEKTDRNLYMNSYGQITARIFDGNSKVVSSTKSISAATWSHIAITGNGGNLKLYINGILDKTISTGTAITNYSTPEFILGQATETGSYFEGQISDVRLYDHALTDSEIAGISGMVFTITSGAGSGGTINPSGSVNVSIGTNKSYSITPNSGFKISDVRIDNVPVGPVSDYTFTYVTGNHTINATFTPLNIFSVTSSAGTGGTINPSGIKTFFEGTSQTYTIAANLGYRIADLKVDSVSVGAVQSYTFSNILANHNITAEFTAIPTYTITSSAGTGGVINPGGTITINEGTGLTFNITASLGYKISDILVDGVSAGSVSTFTFTNVTANHTISASFSTTPVYSITAGAGSGGSINPAGTIQLNEGSGQTFMITPNTGYQISDVLVDNISVGKGSTFTFSDVMANHTISASFSIRTFTLTGSAGTNGSVNPAGVQTVNYGTNQTYIFTPNTGYKVADVLVDNISIGTPSSYTFNNINSNHTISVTFSLITYSISARSSTGGTISPQGNITVNYGANQSFTMTAGVGYYLSDLMVDNVSLGPVSSYTFSNVTSGHTISATFSPITYSITSSAGSGGSISPVGVISVNHGSNRTFSITAGFGYQVSDVKIDNVSAGAISTYTFSNITSSHSITASFATATYAINASAGTGGSISPMGISTMNHGDNRTYTITAETGYRVSDVRIDNSSIGAVNSYTFNNITSNHTITATFSIITYTLEARAGNGGSITPQGNLTVNYATNRTFSITPNEGFHISDVLIDNISAGPITDYTFYNITNDHTISASFAHITFTIDGNAGEGGSISPAGVSSVNYGDDAAYVITPATGYLISDVKVDDVSIGNISSYTFERVVSNHKISVSFTPITFEIKGSSNPGGSISSTGIINVNYGTDLVYHITPDTGYQIADVIVDSSSVGVVSSYTFTNITRPHSITVSFKIIQYIISGSSNSGGSISPYGELTVNYGSNQEYIISPDSGYKIIDVKIDNNSVGAVTTYTFNDITDNHNISATFKLLETYVISANAGPGGLISPKGEISLSEGSDQTYLITPSEGYRIYEVVVDNGSVGAASEYSFSNLASDHNIYVTFTTTTEVDVYPNPFMEEFNLMIATPENNLFEISIVDLSGKTVYIQNKVQGNTIIPVQPNISKGFYFLKVYCSGRKITVIKLIKS